MDIEILHGLPLSRFIAILVGISLVICASLLIIFLGTITHNTSPVTSGSGWVLESYADATGILVPVITGTNITVRFGSDANITGTSGCNRYVAAYLVKGNLVAITPPISTKMSCTQPGIMQQENAYLANLPKATSIQQAAGEMKLLDSNKKILLKFRPE
ncbi:MAG: META domain-containing protein [Methanoregula sp.]|jgi:heat shock protein HslJ